MVRILEYESPPQEKAVDDYAFLALVVGFFSGLYTGLFCIAGMVFTHGYATVIIFCLAYVPEVLAAVLGCIGLWNCMRHRATLTGAGMALVGIVFALVWTIPLVMALLM